MTKEECDEFIQWLELKAGSRLLEVACGSGGVSCYISEQTHAEVIGLDVNEQAVKAASERVLNSRLEDSVHFKIVDASGLLPFPDNDFHSVFCNDSINHLADRLTVLKEWNRVLQPGGLVLYTDPIVVTGILTNDEITVRSSIGFFLYTPLGENERLLKQAGFTVIKRENLTDRTAKVSRRWFEAREKREKDLTAFEGRHGFNDLQDFLKVVYTLSSEGRLSRYAYLARKE